MGSQPAVDGVSSSDEVVGWGPRSGYVFQKGFVEFFAEKSDVEKIERKVAEEGKGWVHYFAGDRKVNVFFFSLNSHLRRVVVFLTPRSQG